MIRIIDRIGAHSGMTYYNNALCELLNENGIMATVYSNYDSDKAEKVLNNFYCKNKIANLFKSLFALFTKLKRQEWHVVYIFGMSLLDMLIYLVVCTRTTNIILLIHDFENLKSGNKHLKRFAKYIFKRNKQFIVHSIEVKSEILKLNPKANIIYVPHFDFSIEKNVDDNKIRMELRDVVVNNKINVLLFGHLREQKGLSVLSSAIKKQKNENELLKYNFIVAGKNAEFQLEKYVYNLSENERMRIKCFDSFINDDEMKWLFLKCDIVLLPYKKIYQSGVLHMAKLFEKRVVATNLPYFEEVKKNGYQNVVTFDLNDPLTLFEAMATRECYMTESSTSAQMVFFVNYIKNVVA